MQTGILPPAVAAKIAWALTGSFCSEQFSQDAAVLVEQSIKNMISLAEKDDNELRYVTSSVAAIRATRRSLEVAYKGRQNNFADNNKLRSAYLESVKERVNFGEKAKDFLRSLPAMTVGTAGGITVGEMLGLESSTLWLLGILSAGLGYLVNYIIVVTARRRTQYLYLRQDYERNLYFEQYTNRITLILTTLFIEIQAIHKSVFGQEFPYDNTENEIIKSLLNGVRPDYCKFLHAHMAANLITPELWPKCETALVDSPDKCDLWGK